MRRFNTQTHRKLMHESEYALGQAAKSSNGRESRIAAAVLNDPRRQRQWGGMHAELLAPVAATQRRRRQIIALRKLAVELVHRTALVNFLRQNEISGHARRQLFRLLHATHDYEDAVVAEYNRYVLAAASRIAADHLLDVMGTTRSRDLLDMYETVYARYFEIRCEVACEQDTDCAAVMHTSEEELHEQLQRIHERIVSGKPRSRGRNFDRQHALAQSGRYPILNYMVG